MLLEILQNTDYPFFIQIDKEKTNEIRFLTQKLYLIRQNDITKSGLSIH